MKTLPGCIKSNKRSFLLLFTIVLSFVFSLNVIKAQTIVTVGGGASISGCNVPPATWTTPPAGATFSNWSRGTGVTCESAGDALSGSAFNTASPAASFTANKYYKVTITADDDHLLVLSQVTWVTALSGTASGTKFTIQYKNNGGTLTTFGTASQGGTTTNSFTGSITVNPGTSLEVFLIPSNANAATGTVRFKNGSSFTITSSIVLVQNDFTGLSVPQYCSSGDNTRLPVMYRATISGLSASTTYRYYSQAAESTDFLTTNPGAGNPLLINTGGSTYSYSTSPGLTSAGSYQTFTTDASGSYTGWFGFVNTNNARFTSGKTIYPTIVIGNTSGTLLYMKALDLGMSVLAFGTASSNGTFLKQTGTSATAKNFVILYNNTAGTGRPLYITPVESTGVTIGQTITGYSAATGSWNAIIPNNNANGVRRIEQRNFANTLIGCVPTDTDGNWPTGPVNTASPDDGTTALLISTTDVLLSSISPSAPVVFTPVYYCQNATPVALTATGTNLLWYTASSGGTGTSTAPIPSTATVGAPVLTRWVTQTLNSCESPRAQIAVNVRALPSAPTVTTPVEYCQNTAATQLSVLASGTLSWYTQASGGTSDVNAPIPSTLTAGTPALSYWVTQTDANNCESPRTEIDVNIYEIPSAPVLSSNSPVSIGDNITLFAATVPGATYSWNGPSSFITTSQNPVIATADISDAGTYEATVTINGCESVASSIDLVVAAYYRSATDGNFSSIGIWETSSDSTSWVSANVVPGTSIGSVVIMPATTVTVDAPVTVQNLYISSGAVVEGGSTLTIHGNLVHDGTFNHNLSTVILGGNGNQSVKGNKAVTFYNLSASNAGTKTMENDVNMVNTFTLSDNASIDADGTAGNKKFRLLSDNSRTARINKLITPSNFSGKIYMHRYVPAQRRTRYFSSSVQGATIAQWKDSVMISGPAAGGFDAPNVSKSSVQYYNEATTQWKGLTAISQTLQPGVGYNIFVAGKRTTVYPNAEEVTMVLKGEPNKGDITLPVTYTTAGASGWNLVGNPYPSQISWDSTGWTKTNIDNAFYIWNPDIGTKGGYYSYVNGIASDGRTNGDVIASSQSFFVKANAASPALIITESAKVGQTYTPNFKTGSAGSDLIRLKLTTPASFDYAVLYLQSEASFGFEKELDAYKMLSTEANLYLLTPEKEQLSIDAIPVPVDTFSIPLVFTSNTAGQHTFSCVNYDYQQKDSLYLIDHYQQDTITIHARLNYSFVVNADTASYSKKRFVITNYHKEAETSVVTAITNAENDFSCKIYPNPVEGSAITILASPTQSIHHIIIYDLLGRVLADIQSSDRKGWGNQYEFHFPQTLSAEVYFIKILSVDGSVDIQKIIKR